MAGYNSGALDRTSAEMVDRRQNYRWSTREHLNLRPPVSNLSLQRLCSNGTIDFAKRRGFISQELHTYYSRKCRPIRDDILICKSGATTGKLARVDTDREFSIWSPLAMVRSKRSRILPRFLEMALETGYVQDQIKRTWSAGTQPNISMGDLERLHVVAPDINEQAKIIKYVDTKTGGFGPIISKVREAIDRLKELRSSLISAAVTGKIDVREVV